MSLITRPNLLLAGIAVLLLSHSPSVAQQNGSEQADSVHARNDCRLAAQVIRTGNPATRLTWAVELAPFCPTLGPSALAARWRAVPDGASEVGDLTRASMRLRDGGFYLELLQIADDASRPPRIRVAAMLVLAKYVNPGSGVWLTDLVPPDSIRRIPMALGSTTYTSYAEGAVPMPRGIAPQVLAILERLAADRAGQPREVWYAAGMLAKRVRADAEHLPEP